MSEEKERPIMSRRVVNSGSESIRGYLNEQEFVDAVAKNYQKWAGFGFAIAIGVAVLESLATNYNGKYAPLLVMAASVVGAYLKTMRDAKKFMNEGEEPK